MKENNLLALKGAWYLLLFLVQNSPEPWINPWITFTLKLRISFSGNLHFETKVTDDDEQGGLWSIVNAIYSRYQYIENVLKIQYNTLSFKCLS